MPRSRHRENAHARPHRAMPRAVHAQAGAMTHHDSLSGDHNPKMTHHDSPPGDENPPMTQNDSLCHASNPQMTQNDSLCHASMTQMTQNDSHFEVSSFEMTQNDSFPALNVPLNTPLSPADELPATPPYPQNDTPRYTPGCDPGAAGHAFAAGSLPQGISLVASSIFSRRVVLRGAMNLTHIRETPHSAPGDNLKTLPRAARAIAF